MLSKEGWVCPICGRGLSPWTSECPCYVNKGYSNTTISSTTYSGYIDIPLIGTNPKGHWISASGKTSNGFGTWTCSICGRNIRGRKENLPFCNCGADMREEPDGGLQDEEA